MTTTQRYFEAVWTLADGPLDNQKTAADLFVAIGDIRDVQPARYDLNRRGQWRDYDGRGLMVDVVTQRTQLVIIAEDKPIDDGGAMVVVSTGKQGDLPRASVRWKGQWPPQPEHLDRWRRGVERAFRDLDLVSFVMRVAPGADRLADAGEVVMAATTDRRIAGCIDDVAPGRGRPLGGSGVVGRSFFGDDGRPTDEWNELWT